MRPESLAEHFVNDLFPAAQGVVDSPAVCVCMCVCAVNDMTYDMTYDDDCCSSDGC